MTTAPKPSCASQSSPELPETSATPTLHQLPHSLPRTPPLVPCPLPSTATPSALRADPSCASQAPQTQAALGSQACCWYFQGSRFNFPPGLCPPWIPPSLDPGQDPGPGMPPTLLTSPQPGVLTASPSGWAPPPKPGTTLPTPIPPSSSETSQDPTSHHHPQEEGPPRLAARPRGIGWGHAWVGERGPGLGFASIPQAETILQSANRLLTAQGSAAGEPREGARACEAVWAAGRRSRREALCQGHGEGVAITHKGSINNTGRWVGSRRGKENRQCRRDTQGWRENAGTGSHGDLEAQAQKGSWDAQRTPEGADTPQTQGWAWRSARGCPSSNTRPGLAGRTGWLSTLPAEPSSGAPAGSGAQVSPHHESHCGLGLDLAFGVPVIDVAAHRTGVHACGGRPLGWVGGTVEGWGGQGRHADHPGHTHPWVRRGFHSRACGSRAGHRAEAEGGC